MDGDGGHTRFYFDPCLFPFLISLILLSCVYLGNKASSSLHLRDINGFIGLTILDLFIFKLPLMHVTCACNADAKILLNKQESIRNYFVFLGV